MTKLKLYGVVHNGDLLYETLADSPTEAIDGIGSERFESYILERGAYMAGHIKIHHIEVDIGDAIHPGDYPTEKPDVKD
jgi:hypothetical protein